MVYVSIPEETKELMDRVMPDIKGDYITQKLFLDSAVRQKLRNMGIKAGEDLVVGHLRRLEKNKAQHYEKSSLAITRARHARRVARAEQQLNEGIS